MTLRVRALVYTGIFAGAGAIGIFAPALVPTRFVGGHLEVMLGFIAVSLAIFDAPALLLLARVSTNLSFNFIVSPFVSFVFYALLFQGVISLASWINPKRKV